MPASKRMSAEEKRQAILQIYHATKQVYTEKEIVVLAAKAGVNANTIVDVNKALVDDGLVDAEKISGSNYYWSFPAKQDHLQQMEHQHNLQVVLPDLQQQVQKAQEQLQAAQRGREDTDDNANGNSRAAQLQRLTDLARQNAQLEAEINGLRENDPQALADLQQELQLCTQAAHRWTDNLFQCQDYLVKKRGMDKKMVQKMIGIGSAFDYPEDKIPK